MATKKATKSAQPGDRFQEGVCVKISDDGLYLGRAAKAGEELPPEHSEHTFDGQRVFLSDHQCAIPRERLTAK